MPKNFRDRRSGFWDNDLMPDLTPDLMPDLRPKKIKYYWVLKQLVYNPITIAVRNAIAFQVLTPIFIIVRIDPQSGPSRGALSGGHLALRFSHTHIRLHPKPPFPHSDFFPTPLHDPQVAKSSPGRCSLIWCGAPQISPGSCLTLFGQCVCLFSGASDLNWACTASVYRFSPPVPGHFQAGAPQNLAVQKK